MDGYYHSKVNSIHFISETVMKPPVPQKCNIETGHKEIHFMERRIDIN
jgi:hypothetical protein